MLEQANCTQKFILAYVPLSDIFISDVDFVFPDKQTIRNMVDEATALSFSHDDWWLIIQGDENIQYVIDDHIAAILSFYMLLSESTDMIVYYCTLQHHI